MTTPQPTPPERLHPFARALLESLAGHPEAAEIVIGGGVALSHYLEYRDTVDLDAWWKTEPRADVLALLEETMRAIASRSGLGYHRRSWGETESLELLRDGIKLFSFQISRRTLALDEAIPSRWQPVGIETLRDNVGDRSVYPDMEPPARFSTLEDRADYMQRICAAFDFGVFPEEADWVRFAGWRDVFDRFPLPDSPGYHAFRHWYGWEPVPVQRRLGIAPWKSSDLQEGRTDPCEDLV